MKKKALSLVLAAVLACFAYASVGTVYAEENEKEVRNASEGTLLYETDVITQKDYEGGFQRYALSEATINFVSNMRTFSNGELANVVGVVKDYDTEELISGATISVNGDAIVATGADGRFQIKNIPSGEYNWEISATGYYTADYSNYDVDAADGATIFTFYISHDFNISQDREVVVQDNKGGQTVPPDVVDRGNYVTSATAKTRSSLPSVSNTVEVYYNNKTQSVNRQTYIYTVLSSELYETNYYIGKGLTLTQIKELYHAQAIAANTFLEYAQCVYSNHSSYEVCSTQCCQVYDPTKVTQMAIEATAKIFYTIGGQSRTDIVMYKESSTTFDYIWGAFFSSCGNSGTKTHSTDPALKKVSCTDIASGAGGHGYGLCQMGAAKRAKDGASASNILLYYYTDCCIATCLME